MADEAINAYAAGIIDGEGCITAGLNTGSSVTVNFTVFVGSTDQRLTDWLQEHFGGRVLLRSREKLGHKDLYQWQARKGEAVAMLTAIYPYMVIKREQVNVFLALADLQSNAKKGNGPLPAEVVAAKHEALAEFRRLNMRGRV